MNRKTPMTPSLRNKALDLLARREHSRLELREKLRLSIKKWGVADQSEAENSTGSFDEIEPILDRLEEEGLLSDERMAEALARTRIGTGKGPRWIAQELRQKGVCNKIIDNVLNQSDNREWLERGRKVYLQKFGTQPPQTLQERARCSRFLTYRGFYYDQVNHILDALSSDRASSHFFEEDEL
jgi:regulatory protein